MATSNGRVVYSSLSKIEKKENGKVCHEDDEFREPVWDVSKGKKTNLSDAKSPKEDYSYQFPLQSEDFIDEEYDSVTSLSGRVENLGLTRMQNSDLPNEGNKFQVRKLEITDKSKGFIELLQQLSVCDFVTDKQFGERFQELSAYGDDHIVCVIEDDHSGKIIATGSMFIEKKFLRNCGKVGHIEDVVVDEGARGMQLGKKIIEFLTNHAQDMECYKVILDCSVDNKAFYEKCGFKQKEIQMVRYFV